MRITIRGVDYHEWSPEAPESRPARPAPDEPQRDRVAPADPRREDGRVERRQPGIAPGGYRSVTPPSGFAPDDLSQGGFTQGGLTPAWGGGQLEPRVPRPREQDERGFDGFAVRGGVRARSDAQEIVPRPETKTPVASPVPKLLLPGSFDDDRDYPIVMWWTAIWYVVPTILYATWALTQSTTPQPGCASVTGGTCPSPRVDAIHAVTGNLFAISLAIVLSAVVAAGIRRWTLAWRPITTGFAAAVIGAGIVTLVVSFL